MIRISSTRRSSFSYAGEERASQLNPRAGEREGTAECFEVIPPTLRVRGKGISGDMKNLDSFNSHA